MVRLKSTSLSCLLVIVKSLGIGAGDAKAMAALTEADKEFEEKVRKSWQLMHSLVSTLHENVVKSNTALTGAPPLNPFFILHVFVLNSKINSNPDLWYLYCFCDNVIIFCIYLYYFADLAKPFSAVEGALSNYYRECRVATDEVKEFSNSGMHVPATWCACMARACACRG
jgi:hypothetical protein